MSNILLAAPRSACGPIYDTNSMIHKRNYLLLKLAKTKPELAALLNISPSFLTRVLYHPGVEHHYNSFTIPKSSGGARSINAPSKELKDIQKRLANLLLDCKDVILRDNKVKCTFSHGFERKKSIITNAAQHQNKKVVLNLDLSDFFGSFNFGRVRGFFISNRYFKLDPHIATVIAQIACFNNSLPQGSPCSPIISNLISNSLDIRLSTLAQKNGCTYTRYADDVTFSTRKPTLPTSILKELNPVTLGSRLIKEIESAGFLINHKKTRVQLKDSRQEATGLIVNKKVNIRAEYWRDVRAMAHSLFKYGSYEIKEMNGNKRKGTIQELEGRLTFIDHLDHYNNIIRSKKPKPIFEPAKHLGLFHFRNKLSSREKTYSIFLFYKHFYANSYPTIMTEGKTDNIYLKCALNSLQNEYPSLAKKKSITQQYEPKLSFLNLNKKTMYFLDIEGGASHFQRFVARYESEFKYFTNQSPSAPVIMILDNDSGPNALINDLSKKQSSNSVPIRKQRFTHIIHNLYLILTPLGNSENTMMEDLFDKNTLSIKIDGKSFSKKDNFDIKKEYGKHIFSTKVITQHRDTIDFHKFKYIFDAIVDVCSHFSGNKG